MKRSVSGSEVAGHFLADILAERGVKLVRDQLAERIEPEAEGVVVVTSDGARHRAGMAFVAIGRMPDLGRLIWPKANR